MNCKKALRYFEVELITQSIDCSMVAAQFTKSEGYNPQACKISVVIESEVQA